MNKHYMNLADQPFRLIIQGKKSIEMRLNDERRQILKVGDAICFTNNTTQETLITEILSLVSYPDFETLYANYDKVLLGYSEKEVAKPSDMSIYYSQENIAKYGVLAIEIRVV